MRRCPLTHPLSSRMPSHDPRRYRLQASTDPEDHRHTRDRQTAEPLPARSIQRYTYPLGNSMQDPSHTSPKYTMPARKHQRTHRRQPQCIDLCTRNTQEPLLSRIVPQTQNSPHRCRRRCHPTQVPTWRPRTPSPSPPKRIANSGRAMGWPLLNRPQNGTADGLAELRAGEDQVAAESRPVTGSDPSIHLSLQVLLVLGFP